MGTPKYMSPEQAEGREVDQRSDLFSLGSVLYLSIAGKAPFQGRSLAATLVSVISTEPQPLNQVRDDTPIELSDLVAKLMAKNADERPTSSESVAAAFARLEGHVPDAKLAEAKPATPTNQPASQAQSSNSKRGFFPGYVLGAALALGFLAFLAGIVIQWKTPAGTVFVTIDPADSVTSVDVSQDALTITDPNDGMKIHITVDEANGKMRLEKEGFTAVVTEFNLSSPDGRNIAVRFVPSSPKVSKGNSEVSDMPSNNSVNTERQIAQWILGQGGTVQVQVGDSGSRNNVETIAALPQEEFSVSRVTLLQVEREAEMAILTGIKGEVSVWMPGTTITGTCFEHLGKIPKLEGLNFQDCRNIDPANVKMLSSEQMLQSVLLLNSNLGNEVAELAVQIRSLFHVEFGRLLTGEGLQTLKDCEHVTEISLLGCTLLTSDDFRYLQDIPKLNQIALDPTHVDATSVKHLAKVAGLRTLRINDINNSGALDVSELGKLDALVELDLSYGVVNVEQLEPLQGMRSLRLLSLRGTGLSQADIERIGQLLPHCELVTDDGTIPPAESNR